MLLLYKIDLNIGVCDSSYGLK